MAKQYTKAELEAMGPDAASEASEGMPEHPEDYDGPCLCDSCLRDHGEPAEEEKEP